MYFLMCFLVRVFGTITGKITTEYLTPGYYRPVTGVSILRDPHSLYSMDRFFSDAMSSTQTYGDSKYIECMIYCFNRTVTRGYPLVCGRLLQVRVTRQVPSISGTAT